MKDDPAGSRLERPVVGVEEEIRNARKANLCGDLDGG